MISCIRQEISREEASLRELCQSLPPSSKKRGRFSTWISRQWRRRGRQPGDSVSGWTLDEVSSWLGSLGLSEYSEQFKANDVRGAELLHLEKADLNDLGVSKIGHIKRLQVGKKEQIYHSLSFLSLENSDHTPDRQFLILAN